MLSPRLFVLAGGLGTRLRSAIADIPKALAPVAGQPYLHYMLKSWVTQGITRMTFLLHHQAEQIIDFLGEQGRLPQFSHCELTAIVEPRLLGTGGAVAYAVRETGQDEPFLVTNADTWLGDGIPALSVAEPPAIGVIRVCDASRYGTVGIADAKILAFKEKQDRREAGWINAGLYHLHPEHFSAWDGEPFSIERDLFPRLATARILTAVALDTEFIDIGIPSDYRRFCAWMESGKANPL